MKKIKSTSITWKSQHLLAFNKEQYTNISCFCNEDEIPKYNLYYFLTATHLYPIYNTKIYRSYKETTSQGIKTSLDKNKFGQFFLKKVNCCDCKQLHDILQLLLVCCPINHHVNLPYHYTSIVVPLHILDSPSSKSKVVWGINMLFARIVIHCYACYHHHNIVFIVHPRA